MRQELEGKSTPWIVIDFNAWQHQRTGPPWWSLIDTVFDQSVQKLRKISIGRSLKLFIWEHFWRLRVGHSFYLWLPAVIFGVIGLIILFNSHDTATIPSKDATPPFDSFLNFLNTKVGAVISLAVSVLSSVQALRSSLVPGSERAAQEFVELTNDPMSQLSRHFNALVKRIKQPLAIFIDDLDRCRDSYTVEFLEGIQTLFREADVNYVIAADRRWIYTSYEKTYDTFKTALDEPGFPFGELFLSKIFQLSAYLPRISASIQNRYFERLLLISQSKTQSDLNQARESAQQKLQGLSEHNTKNECPGKQQQSSDIDKLICI